MSYSIAPVIQLETSIELFPGLEDIMVLVEGTVDMFIDDNADADADGNRGHVRTEITEVEITGLWLYLPNRPTLLVGRKPPGVMAFLSEPEYDSLCEQLCEKAFKERCEL